MPAKPSRVVRPAATSGDSRATARASALYVIPSILFLLVVGVHWAQPPTVVAQIDLPPPFGVANVLQKCAFAWSDVHSYFGSVDNCSSWYPYSAVLLGLDTLFGPSYGQALTFVATVIVSWLGAFAFARSLGAKPAAACLAGWVYAFNPVRQLMFGEFATGEVCAALLPWVAYWIAVAAREPYRRAWARAAIVTIAFFPLSVLAATPQLLVALIIGSLAVLAFALVRWSGDRRSFADWSAGTLVWSLAASLWWTLPNAVSYLGVALEHPATADSVAWTFDRASLLNELRFCALWVWRYAEYNPWAVEFERNAWLYASGFVPAALLIVALVVCRGPRLSAVRFFGALALIMLFIAKGEHPPLAQANQAFFALPGMFLLIEPYGPILVAALALSACAALGADALLAAASAWRVRAGYAVVAASIAALCWNNLAAITGAIFHEKTNFTPGEHIALPQEWIDAAKFLNDSAAPGGVVVLPPDDHYQADYDWGYRGVDLVAIELVRRDVLMPGAPWWYTQLPESISLDAAVDHVIAAHSPLGRALLIDLGVRYALVRDDVHPVSQGLTPKPREYARMFGGPPVAVFGGIELYDLGSAAAPLMQMADASARDVDAGDIEVLRAAGLGEADPGRSDGAGGLLISDLHPITISRTFTGQDMRPFDLRPYAPIPKLVSRTQSSAALIAYDVVNPAPEDTISDVRIGVWPRWPTTYALSANGQVSNASVDASDVAVWCAFPGVVLHPGMNHLEFRQPDTLVRSFAAFLPPRFSIDQPWRPHVNEMSFSDVRAEARARRPTDVDPGIASKAVRIDMTLDDDPRVTIVRPPSEDDRPVAAVIALSQAGHRRACVDEFIPGQEYRLTDSVRDCFDAVGETLTDVDAASTRVDALILPASALTAGPGDSVHASFTANAPDGLSASSQRSSPTIDVPYGGANGLGAIVTVKPAAGAALVLGQVFSSTWIAIDISHWRVLPHWRAFGWRNAWAGPAGATVVVLNWLSALTLALLAAGALVVVFAWLRR